MPSLSLAPTPSATSHTISLLQSRLLPASLVPSALQDREDTLGQQHGTRAQPSTALNSLTLWQPLGSFSSCCYSNAAAVTDYPVQCLVIIGQCQARH